MLSRMQDRTYYCRDDDIVKGEGENPIILVHVGTNNVPKGSVCNITSKYNALIDQFKRKCPNATLVFSGILDRRDRWYLSSKIGAVNQELSRLCEERGIEFLNHSFLTRGRVGWLGISSTLTLAVTQFLGTHFDTLYATR